MPAAIEGAIIGAAIGLVLLGAEFMLLKKSAREQAVKLHRAPALDETAKRRIATMARFAAILPFAFAAFYWYIWG